MLSSCGDISTFVYTERPRHNAESQFLGPKAVVKTSTHEKGGARFTEHDLKPH